MNYDAELQTKGIKKERIRHYGFVFEGKKSVDRIRNGEMNEN